MDKQHFFTFSFFLSSLFLLVAETEKGIQIKHIKSWNEFESGIYNKEAILEIGVSGIYLEKICIVDLHK